MAEQEIQLAAPIPISGEQVNNNNNFNAAPTSVAQIRVFKFAPDSVTDFDDRQLYVLTHNKIFDLSRNEVAFIKKKAFSPYGVWVVLNGDSEHAIMLFSVEKASLWFSQGDLLVPETDMNELFQMKGSWEKKNYCIYTRKQMIAEMEPMGDNDRFKVNVFSDAHREIIIKLFATLQVMNRSTRVVS